VPQGGRYHVVHPEHVNNDDPSPLNDKDVHVDKRRYIVGFHDDEARKDAADRDAIAREVHGTCGRVFQAVRVALPTTVQQLSPTIPEVDAAKSATPQD
jgi:hypothetical protein